jgi:hypothetical protein
MALTRNQAAVSVCVSFVIAGVFGGKPLIVVLAGSAADFLTALIGSVHVTIAALSS